MSPCRSLSPPLPPSLPPPLSLCVLVFIFLGRPRRGATPIQNHTSRSQHQSTQRSGLSQHQSTQRSGFYQHQYTQRTRPSSGCDKKTGSARLSNEGSSKSATEARKQESPRSGVIPEKTERDERTIDSAKIPSVSTSRSQSVRSSDFSISTRR